VSFQITTASLSSDTAVYRFGECPVPIKRGLSRCSKRARWRGPQAVGFGNASSSSCVMVFSTRSRRISGRSHAGTGGDLCLEPLSTDETLRGAFRIRDEAERSGILQKGAAHQVMPLSSGGKICGLRGDLRPEPEPGSLRSLSAPDSSPSSIQDWEQGDQLGARVLWRGRCWSSNWRVRVAVGSPALRFVLKTLFKIRGKVRVSFMVFTNGLTLILTEDERYGPSLAQTLRGGKRRALVCPVYSDSTRFVVVNGFAKKTEKTPRQEIDVASGAPPGLAELSRTSTMSDLTKYTQARAARDPNLLMVSK